MPETTDIKGLSEATGVSVRTIRYYLAENLLPPPQGRGSAAVYGAGHRNRLCLIRQLQDAHLPLAAIRRQLEALDDTGVAAALAAPQSLPPSPAGADALSAADYVRRVLADSKTGQHRSLAGRGVSSRPKGAAEPDASEPKRSAWERIALTPDLELHVRRPLARSDQRRLDALLAEARRLFLGDPD
jgi:DNA-binding transcriptional MerR regulator